MKFTIATVFAATLGLVELASAYPITHTTSLHCRASPSASATLDKTQDGCYVADYYVKTGASGFVTKSCSSGGSGGGSIPGPEVDDYIYKGSCSGTDPWNFYRCQCTSFVAQRINKRLGISFTNRYKGCAFGNANQWYGAAKSCGVNVNSTQCLVPLLSTREANMAMLLGSILFLVIKLRSKSTTGTILKAMELALFLPAASTISTLKFRHG
ncbi:hypothetical protein Unana1_00076 [Umbelopsis nana]